MKMRVIATSVMGLVVVLGFQNCSNTNFGSIPESSEKGLAQAQTCRFNGRDLNEGESVLAYLESSVPVGATCTSETRVCHEGVLSGGMIYPTCSVNAPRSCALGNQIIPHGGSVIVYQNSSVPAGQTCASETRVCNDGQLSGSYVYASCTPGTYSACLFNNQTVAHNGSVTAYLNSTVPAGRQCQKETRICYDGQLSGSYTYASCSVGAYAACSFNGQTIPHGGSVQAYAQSNVAAGQSCLAQNRVCNNGTLSGSYLYGSCTVAAYASCAFNGQTIAHGQTIKVYQAPSVAYGQSCVAQNRTCNNGVLSGSYLSSTCTVDPQPTYINETFTDQVNALICAKGDPGYESRAVYNGVSYALSDADKSAIISTYRGLKDHLGRCAELAGFQYWLGTIASLMYGPDHMTDSAAVNRTIDLMVIAGAQNPRSLQEQVANAACLAAARTKWGASKVVSATYIVNSGNRCTVVRYP